MPKVLVFTSLFPNATEPELGSFIIKRMAAYASKEKCEVAVVAPVPYFPPIKRFKKYYRFSCVPKIETIDGLTVYHPRYPLIPKISMPFHGLMIFLSSIATMIRIIKRFPIDIIDAHFIYPDGFAAVLLGKLFSIPVVVSARGSDINEFTCFPSILPMIRYTLKRADAVISVCLALKNMMVSFNISSDKIIVIPNGIDTQKFYYINQFISKRHLGITNHIPILLSVGALIERKGHSITIEAVKKLKEKYPDFILFIIGKGELRIELDELSERLGIKDNIRFMGMIPNHELVYWYNAADIFCLSSSREGWANVLTESIACGTPVVATNVFGAPEIITNGVNGYLVDRSEKSIAKGIHMVLSKKWNRKRISEKGSIRTWEVVADEVAHVFDAVLLNINSSRDLQ